MLDRRWRQGVERGLGPLGRGLRRLGVPADALTVFGLLASVATAFLIASGHLAWAVVGVIVAGVSDLLDGAIARGSGSASPRGAFFDSVTDRVSDALLLGGCAWYLAGRSPYESILAFAVAACSMLVSYERARAESLGLDARGGLMERAERFVFLGFGLAFNVIVPVLWVMLVLTALTAGYRFVRVYRQAAHPPRVHTRRGRLLSRDDRVAPEDNALVDANRPAPLRMWWTARRMEGRRMEGDRTRRRHPSVRRNSRP
ncbi:MAG TPA: CDP-alcohol phosphatidyltransferase family protein [Acidimicrobiia bacterium]|jgi:CDP-diacylglycerol--glycerol-3-phosphate 3-phosphatidyltransferase|nr:CDP-alcohol phosphatidyltransferase family protein [Acidimicrobiia bacterium]